ncbi:hypothetical protein MBOT_21850 [Mycobacterium botniense]|uniref:Uncharacterized protein n=1 Tax=Mycobacterium botniense TaxID=84962 RepID=A0A7I9XYI1_9MYCO|nr:hypothetical protein MBOT_21850 [Mycobacterium botniense]
MFRRWAEKSADEKLRNVAGDIIDAHRGGTLDAMLPRRTTLVEALAMRRGGRGHRFDR